MEITEYCLNGEQPWFWRLSAAALFCLFSVSKCTSPKKTGFSIQILVKIVLGIIIIMFTLEVSDLGDMIDKLFI
ncbi:hypothetical protein [Adhaeribacter rhizoryzae]|uniref:Uncharacterized protein n=1 Tax=Adhaeribacter rhizoryzae TaxID=2607907 RepID=A0A5M6DS79_9BACT|nr:hypothetical protein [Adhaeribacter rhizoryzae]KAA5548265.1 hypothetical protein F0145_05935 [Adhaeribacter rhizoryzae]